jgi:DNA repair exonuclease SbcCD ATPase subunit
MNMLKVFALIVISVFAVSTVHAQDLSKSEKKKLKTELKKYKKNPVDYKNDKAKTRQQLDERDETIVELTKQLDEQNSRSRRLQDSLEALSKKYNNLIASSSTSIPAGTVYAVQIGFFEVLQLEEFNKRIRTIRAENQDGGKRYVIGYFNDLEQAKKFGSEIKTIGIDDAFVSQYINGVRNMKFDALKAH